MCTTVKKVTVTGIATFIDGKFSEFISKTIHNVQIVRNSEEIGIGSKVIYARPIHGYAGTSLWHITRPEIVGKTGNVVAISVDGLVTVEYDDVDLDFRVLANRLQLATKKNIAAAEKRYENVQQFCARINEKNETRDKKRKRALH